VGVIVGKIRMPFSYVYIDSFNTQILKRKKVKKKKNQKEKKSKRKKEKKTKSRGQKEKAPDYLQRGQLSIQTRRKNPKCSMCLQNQKKRCGTRVNET